MQWTNSPKRRNCVVKFWKKEHQAQLSIDKLGSLVIVIYSWQARGKGPTSAAVKRVCSFDRGIGWALWFRNATQLLIYSEWLLWFSNPLRTAQTVRIKELQVPVFLVQLAQSERITWPEGVAQCMAWAADLFTLTGFCIGSWVYYDCICFRASSSSILDRVASKSKPGLFIQGWALIYSIVGRWSPS